MNGRKGTRRELYQDKRFSCSIRPQSSVEISAGCRISTYVTPDEPQITHGDRGFTYDYVFDSQTTQAQLYDTCVHALVDGLFDGLNATVLAYGQVSALHKVPLIRETLLQTGSGKTFTMGTNWTGLLDAEQVRCTKCAFFIRKKICRWVLYLVQWLKYLTQFVCEKRRHRAARLRFVFSSLRCVR